MIPVVLLIGDSIRMGYGPLVREMLAEQVEVVEIPENGGDSANVQAKLSTWLGQVDLNRLRVVHFNCGLHDIKRPYGSIQRQQSLSAYRDNLENIVQELRTRTTAQLIWATITPVHSKRHHRRKGFDRFLSDVQRYNAAALEVMDRFRVPVNDLYRVILQYGIEECLAEDGVHMTQLGNELLAEAVAQRIIANAFRFG